MSYFFDQDSIEKNIVNLQDINEWRIVNDRKSNHKINQVSWKVFLHSFFQKL